VAQNSEGKEILTLTNKRGQAIAYTIVSIAICALMVRVTFPYTRIVEIGGERIGYEVAPTLTVQVFGITMALAFLFFAICFGRLIFRQYLLYADDDLLRVQSAIGILFYPETVRLTDIEKIELSEFKLMIVNALGMILPELRGCKLRFETESRVYVFTLWFGQIREDRSFIENTLETLKHRVMKGAAGRLNK